MGAKIAPTLVAADRLSVQSLVPEQTPPVAQPVNLLPAAGVAISLTEVPSGSVSVQSVGQLMPAGEDTTVPFPVTTAFSAAVLTGVSVKVAVTSRAAVMAGLQVPVPVPVQPLLHPV